MSPDKLLALVVGNARQECESRRPDGEGHVGVNVADQITQGKLRAGSNPADSLPNLHVQQMRATLMAAEAAGRPLNVTQLRVIWQHGRSFYYRCAEYYGITLPCFETAKQEVQLAYLSAAAESLRDFPPTRCIKCGMPCDDEADLYCSKSCAIDAERDR